MELEYLIQLVDRLVATAEAEVDNLEHTSDPVAVKQWHRGNLHGLHTIQNLLTTARTT